MTALPSASVLALLAAIVAVAFAVETALGFGATLVAVAAGSLVVPIDALLPAFVPINIALSGYVVARHRDAVDWRLLGRRVLPAMGAGLPLGLLAFRLVGAARLQLAFGVFVAALAALELRRSLGASPSPAADRAPSPLVASALLVGGGLAHGAFASGGPMAVYVVGRLETDKRLFRSTLAALWLVLNAALVVGYAIGGKLGPAQGALALAFVPALGIGLVVGEGLHRRVPARLFARLVHALLLGAGLALAARSS